MMYVLRMCGRSIRNMTGTMNVSSACKPLMSCCEELGSYVVFAGINRQATCK